jgi:hypothetical protein
MWPAFPASDYYEDSAPPWSHRTTAVLPVANLDGWRGGQLQGGSHVHLRTVDGGGAQLFPGSLAMSTPQAFLMASQPTLFIGIGVAPRACAADRPRSTRFEPALDLRGFHRWFLRSYTFPSCLPGPNCLVVPARPVVVGAAPTLTCASRLGLPPASATCCDRPLVGLLPSHSVAWRLVAHDRLPVDPCGLQCLPGSPQSSPANLAASPGRPSWYKKFGSLGAVHRPQMGTSRTR